jgi:DNA replication protein DnaC
MSTPQLERLQEHCHRLRLYQIEQELTARLEQAAKKELSYADFLDQLLACEIDAKTHKHHQMRIAMARFPFQKTLESFDFKFQPSIDPKLVRELATGRYIQSGDNVLLLGKALAEGRLEERLKLLTQPQLLICDEIGYLPIDRQGANLFFQLVSRRYERGSIIITSNQSLGAWGEVFGDPIIASAILDRLLRHSITINIKGESFRLKEKRRAGLLDKSAPADPGRTPPPENLQGAIRWPEESTGPGAAESGSKSRSATDSAAPPNAPALMKAGSLTSQASICTSCRQRNRSLSKNRRPQIQTP